MLESLSTCSLARFALVSTFFHSILIESVVFCIGVTVSLVGAADLGVIAEGDAILLSAEVSGFSYGDVIFALLPSPCSEFGSVVDMLFTDIPLVSGSIGELFYYMYLIVLHQSFYTIYLFIDDLANITDNSFLINLGTTSSAPSDISVEYLAVDDSVAEAEECLVFSLAVDESLLDPRDIGSIDLVPSLALIRIQDRQAVCSQDQLLASLIVDCSINFNPVSITCSIDGLPINNCKFRIVY